jgi:nucleotide-binding universal stress UspA family protein
MVIEPERYLSASLLKRVRIAVLVEPLLVVRRVRTAPCPRSEASSKMFWQRRRAPFVLVPSIRGRYPWALRQLVAPHDETPTSAAALAPAADLASRAGAEYVVLHVATPSAERPTESGTFVVPRYLDQPQHKWPAWSREFLERVRCLCYPANIDNIRLVLAHGEVSAAINEFARSNASDLVALAWRGSLEPERARTMRQVIRNGACPVIVFRVKA